jgi:poly(3-hydroxyalkanoate) synthetase
VVAGRRAGEGRAGHGRTRTPGGKPDPAEPSEWGDGRFADAAWEDNPAFYAIRRAYLATCRFGDDLLAAGSHDPVTDAKAQLAWKLAVDSVAPANFLISNPTALRRAIETAGWSVVAGATNFLSDLLFNGGRPRQVDATGFELGRNLAATPGKVVYRNDLMELIQYAPQTERVHAVPLLASPPWINKYYVMDLAPQRSFLEWAVQHERTVFAIKQMARTGFLDAEKMAATFNVLRPNDLIFNYVVSNWLLGEQPKAFDILARNADSTRMPARMHTSYLRSMYVQNLLALRELDLAGQRLNLADVTSDAYVVGAINDHIVPWTSSYESTKLLGGDVRYVLSSGGHIAGIVNPPNPKACYETATKHPEEGAAWRAAAQRYPGTWWEDWAAWAASRAGALTEPPPTGSEAHQPIADAPGQYVQG